MNFASRREKGGTAGRVQADKAKSLLRRFAVQQRDQAKRACIEVGRDQVDALAEQVAAGLRWPPCDTPRKGSGALRCWPVSSGTRVRAFAQHRLPATYPISNATE